MSKGAVKKDKVEEVLPTIEGLQKELSLLQKDPKVEPLPSSSFFLEDKEGNVHDLVPYDEIKIKIDSFLAKNPTDSAIERTVGNLYRVLFVIFNTYVKNLEMSSKNNDLLIFILEQISNLKKVTDIAKKSALKD